MTAFENEAQKEAMDTIAKMTRRFYVQLTEEGFDRVEALALTKVWLAAASAPAPQGPA